MAGVGFLVALRYVFQPTSPRDAASPPGGPGGAEDGKRPKMGTSGGTEEGLKWGGGGRQISVSHKAVVWP